MSLAQNVQEEENAYDEEEDRQLAVALALSLSLEENLQSDEAAENNSSPAHAHPLTELQQIPQECEYCCSSPGWLRREIQALVMYSLHVLT